MALKTGVNNLMFYIDAVPGVEKNWYNIQIQLVIPNLNMHKNDNLLNLLLVVAIVKLI